MSPCLCTGPSDVHRRLQTPTRIVSFRCIVVALLICDVLPQDSRWFSYKQCQHRWDTLVFGSPEPTLTRHYRMHLLVSKSSWCAIHAPLTACAVFATRILRRGNNRAAPHLHSRFQRNCIKALVLPSTWSCLIASACGPQRETDLESDGSFLPART